MFEKDVKMMQMRKDFEAEYSVIQLIVKQSDEKVAEHKDALKKVLKMLQYPRLVKMINKELNQGKEKSVKQTI